MTTIGCGEEISEVYTLGVNGILGLAPERKNTFLSDFYNLHKVNH